MINKKKYKNNEELKNIFKNCFFKLFTNMKL